MSGLVALLEASPIADAIALAMIACAATALAAVMAGGRPERPRPPAPGDEADQAIALTRPLPQRHPGLTRPDDEPFTADGLSAALDKITEEGRG